MLPAAKPLCLILGLAYSAGAPAFESVRPRVVDGTLSRFHQDVTLAAGDGIQVARDLARGERSFTLTGLLFADVNRQLRLVR
jgi:fructose-1-phosphate kinase PfkB-like protein